MKVEVQLLQQQHEIEVAVSRSSSVGVLEFLVTSSTATTTTTNCVVVFGQCLSLLSLSRLFTRTHI